MGAYAMGGWLVEWDEQRGSNHGGLSFGFESIVLGGLRVTECLYNPIKLKIPLLYVPKASLATTRCRPEQKDIS